MLHHIAPVNNARDTLLDERRGAGQNLLIRRPTATANQNGDSPRRLDNLVVKGDIIRRIGLDHIGPEFHRLADEVLYFHEIAVDHIAAGFAVWTKDQRLHHHGHAIVVAFQLERTNVFDAPVCHLRSSGYLKKIHAHAGRIEPHRLQARFFNNRAHRFDRQLATVDIGHIRAKNERGFSTPWKLLQMACLAGGQLDRVRRGFDNDLHGRRHVLDAGEKAGLIEKSVVDGDIEAAAGFGIEEAVEAVGFHGKLTGEGGGWSALMSKVSIGVHWFGSDHCPHSSSARSRPQFWLRSFFPAGEARAHLWRGLPAAW